MPVGGTRRRAPPRGDGATVATLESAGGYRGVQERHYREPTLGVRARAARELSGAGVGECGPGRC